MKREWDQEYERAVVEVAPSGTGGSSGGQSVGQKQAGAGALLDSRLVLQTRAVSKALYRTLMHYSDLSYAELVRLVERATKAARAPAARATRSNYGALGAFLSHLLEAPLALARNPLAVLVLHFTSLVLRNSKRKISGCVIQYSTTK